MWNELLMCMLVTWSNGGIRAASAAPSSEQDEPGVRQPSTAPILHPLDVAMMDAEDETIIALPDDFTLPAALTHSPQSHESSESSESAERSVLLKSTEPLVEPKGPYWYLRTAGSSLAIHTPGPSVPFGHDGMLYHSGVLGQAQALPLAPIVYKGIIHHRPLTSSSSPHTTAGVASLTPHFAVIPYPFVLSSDRRHTQPASAQIGSSSQDEENSNHPSSFGSPSGVYDEEADELDALPRSSRSSSPSPTDDPRLRVTAEPLPPPPPPPPGAAPDPRLRQEASNSSIIFPESYTTDPSHQPIVFPSATTTPPSATPSDDTTAPDDAIPTTTTEEPDETNKKVSIFVPCRGQCRIAAGSACLIDYACLTNNSIR